MKVSLLTGGADKPYVLGITQALVSKGIIVDLIGNDEMGTAEILANSNINFLNLRGNQNSNGSIFQKIIRVLKYYFRLIIYAAITDSTLFHILWINKFVIFDRTFLTIYYKLLGKKLVFTAHNIDQKQRDGGNSFVNKVTLKIFYMLNDHILVHTDKMKAQLINDFNISEGKISVILFGINDTIPKSNLIKSDARAKLEITNHEKVVLFFGYIAPYKGLEYLVRAMAQLRDYDGSYRLIIAGQVKNCQSYWASIESLIEELDLDKYIIKHIKFIPDNYVEVLFRASDVVVLPYKFIFQSGVPFLSYNFGLPVIASDVGSLREVIVEGKTGMICRKEDHIDLADKICKYFESDLYINLEDNSNKIINYANEKYSWDGICTTISDVYEVLIQTNKT